MALDFIAILAYLAGILDGEGTIYLRRRGRNVDFRVAVSMTDREPLDLFQKTFGGGVVHYDVPKGGNKGVFRWAISSSGAERALSALAPYLFIKKRKAQIALASRSFGRLNRWTPNDIFERREQLLAGWAS